MSLASFKDELSEEVSSIFSTDFDVEVVETDYVPKPDDPKITFPNPDAQKQSCKLIETCVLYIDIRRSTELNLAHRRATVAKLYSAFGRAMTRAARYYGGHVRGIIGDRVMVVFDKKDCFKNAVDTAVLMNSVAKHVLNKHFKHNEINCGIGIDYGKMLITKVGIIRRGNETNNYKGLVWLGRTANVASKLTDLANKPETTRQEALLNVGYYYPNIEQWVWLNKSFEQFVDDLPKHSFSRNITHKDPHYYAHHKAYRTVVETSSTPPILMTKEVFLGFKQQCPESDIVKNGWFSKKLVRVAEHQGDIYGGDVVKTAFTK